jgi:hypothetical protein
MSTAQFQRGRFLKAQAGGRGYGLTRIRRPIGPVGVALALPEQCERQPGVAFAVASGTVAMPA